MFHGGPQVIGRPCALLYPCLFSSYCHYLLFILWDLTGYQWPFKAGGGLCWIKMQIW